MLTEMQFVASTVAGGRGAAPVSTFPRAYQVQVSLDGTTGLVRFAFRRAMASFQGTTNGESLAAIPYVYADSEAGIDPKCDSAAPPDADLSSFLPGAKLKALFNN